MTRAVLDDISEHREFQYENYGPNRDLPDGTGKDVEWLAPVVDAARAQPGRFRAYDIEDLFKQEWDYPKDGTPGEQDAANDAATWMRLVREEIAETFMEEDQDRLEVELIQVAGLAVSWIERIRERRLVRAGTWGAAS